jgi:hypothetical protein
MGSNPKEEEEKKFGRGSKGRVELRESVCCNIFSIKEEDGNKSL